MSIHNVKYLFTIDIFLYLSYKTRVFSKHEMRVYCFLQCVLQGKYMFVY